jgi:hypothetical protein
MAGSQDPAFQWKPWFSPAISYVGRLLLGTPVLVPFGMDCWEFLGDVAQASAEWEETNILILSKTRPALHAALLKHLGFLAQNASKRTLRSMTSLRSPIGPESRFPGGKRKTN